VSNASPASPIGTLRYSRTDPFGSLKRFVAMFAEMPVSSLYLMIVGGLLTAFAMAALRRDAGWMLALGLPLLLAAGRAGLPGAIVAWGCAAYVIVLLLAVGALTLRTIGLPLGLGFAAAIALAGFSSMPAAAGQMASSSLSLHRPPAFGIKMAGMLGQLANDPRYAAD